MFTLLKKVQIKQLDNNKLINNMLNNKNKTINNSSSIIYDSDPLFDSSIDNISQILLRAINRKNKDKEEEKQEYNNNNNASRTGLLEEPNI